MCSEAKCSYSSPISGFIEIVSEKGFSLNRIKEKGLKEVNLPGRGRSPVAYFEKDNLFLLRSLSDKGLQLDFYKADENKIIKTLELPSYVTSISSACFDENKSLWLLHIQEHYDIPRRFVLSKSDKNYEEWDNFLIRDEDDEDWFQRIFSLGAPVERPVSVTCGTDNAYLLTHLYFQNIMQINVYRFDPEEKKLVYITGFFPVDEDGVVSSHFSVAGEKLYIFQNRTLTSVRKSDFPEKRDFNEFGKMFFSESEKGVLMFFIPESENGERVAGRIMKETF